MGALSRRVRAGSLVISLPLMAVMAGIAVQAAEISWIGGTDELWSTPTNWSPIEIGDPPQMIHRVPAEGDDVFIGDTTHGSRVLLDADSAVLGSLTLSGGMELDTGGYLLDVGNGTTGVTSVQGDDTRFVISRSQVPWPNDVAFTTDDLRVDVGGVVDLRESRIDVRQRMAVLEGILTGGGVVSLGTNQTPSGSTVFTNDGTIRPNGGHTINLETRDDLILDVDGESESGFLDLSNDGFLGLLGMPESYGGALEMRDSGIASTIHPLVFDGASIDVAAESSSWGATFDGYFVLDNDTQIQIDGNATWDGGFHVIRGVVRLRGMLRMWDISGNSEQVFEAESRFLVEDGSTIYIGSQSPHVDIRSHDLDLDGEMGDVHIDVGYFRSLHVNAPAIDNDLLSPGFDGTIALGGRLTMNVGDGWELDGRLELGSELGAAQLYGTPITVDGGDPGDGLFVRGIDSDAVGDYTIHTDVVFTENGWLGIVEDIGYVRITGSMEANGTLEYFKHYEDYDPPVGTVYRLLDAEGGITGRFARLDFFPLPADRGWYVQYGATRIEAHVVEPLPGDYNASGLVEQADLDVVLGNWGRRADELPAGWLNDLPSGIIDQAELDRVLAGWGDQVILPAAAAAMAVPEPGAIFLLASAALVSACVRPHRPSRRR